MRYRFAALLLASFFSQFLQAQKLYMPRDIKQAFTNETRSMTGLPGKNYWQNRARYNITIIANPPSRTVRGFETISYKNNSRDTLRFLAIRLTLNIHKPGAARANPVSPDYLTTGVHIDSLVVNGSALNRRADDASTVDAVPLSKPLIPGDSAQLQMKWHYDVSLQSGREGMIDSTTYFLAYSYPRIAVYDDYQGWDFNEFTDALEFYNDFNDYTLQVQVPKNYVVWATGTLIDPDAVLQPAAVTKFRNSLTSDEVINVASLQDLQSAKVTTQNATNTWQFTASNVPDVALGLSDHFVWDAGSVVVDAATGRRASVQAAYNDTAADFHNMVSFCKRSLAFLSNYWPGIPYPYEKTTVFHGYAGMEYPMMANDETYADTAFSKFVAAHEIAHTYMPFYMGINETRFGFMDEGWATTFEYLLNLQDQGTKNAGEFYKRFRVARWINDVSADEEQPIITPGPSLSGGGLGNNEYGKPSLGYLAVKDYLGDTLFKKTLHEFMSRWHGKHPIPWDFFNTFNQASGTDLNWFWNNWFFSNYYIDLAVTSVQKTAKGCYTVTIENKGGMDAPFNTVITYADGTNETIHKNIGTWKANQTQATFTIATTKKIQQLVIDGGIFMDANEKDNTWPVK